MVDAAGAKEPVRVTYSDGFDGLPVPSPDGKTAGVDVERVRRIGRPALPGPVESREGARSAEERAAEKPAASHETRTRARTQNSQNTQSKSCSAISACSALIVMIIVARASARGRIEDRDPRRNARSPQASKGASPGRTAKSSASDYIVAELQEDRREAAARAKRLPAAVRVHGRHARRRHRRVASAEHAGASPTIAGGRRARLSFSDNGDVDRRRRLRRLRHRRARQRRTSATTATRRST